MGDVGAVYNLITDRDLQVNFDVVTITELSQMMKAFIGQMAFTTNSGDRVVVDAGSKRHAASVTINGEETAAAELTGTLDGRSFKLTRNSRETMCAPSPLGST
jgi:hypothetical protein